MQHNELRYIAKYLRETWRDVKCACKGKKASIYMGKEITREREIEKGNEKEEKGSERGQEEKRRRKRV